MFKDVLQDDELLMSFAVDMQAKAEGHSYDDDYKALESQYRENEKAIANIVNAIKSGIVAMSLSEELSVLEERKRKLEDSMLEVEKIQIIAEANE